jgi:hypothetical protein
MKIIKGKWIFIVLFLTSVDSNMADIPLAGLGSERRSQIMLFPWSKKKIWHSGCIKEKSIFSSVNNTCILYQCLLWVFLQNHWMFWNQNITARNGANVTEIFGYKYAHYRTKQMYCVTWCPMSVISRISSKISDSIYLYFSFLWLLSLAGKMAVFFWLGSDLTYVVLSL